MMIKPKISSANTNAFNTVEPEVLLNRRSQRQQFDNNGYSIKSVVVLGNYLPRKCGIATFTVDLCEALSGHAPDIDFQVIAMNDKAGVYDYPPRVQFEIGQNRLEQYHSIANRVNRSGADVLCVQHEFGIFGGDYGCYLVEFLKNIELPITLTLHTVLKDPPAEQRLILQQIIEQVAQVIVMGQHAAEFLSSSYRIPREKIILIPHGIPDMEYINPETNKDKLGMNSRKIILTFGLLSPGKGIEYTIDAMPTIVKAHPDVRYLILGSTHPHVKAEHGEAYRESLQLRVEKLGVEDHVQFIDKFLSQSELHEYIGISDVFVTPYLNEAQITSGVLSYGLGMGRAIVSTPFWHAREALDGNRGVLVPFRSEKALAEQISMLLTDDAGRHKLQLRAYQFSRQMVWDQVAASYLKTFEKSIDCSRFRALRQVSI